MDSVFNISADYFIVNCLKTLAMPDQKLYELSKYGLVIGMGSGA